MTTMSNGTVQLDIVDRVATITLDRPDSLNSMTTDLMDDLAEAVNAAEASTEAGVVVLTGNGRGFCSGADLRAVGSTDDSGEAIEADDTTASMDRHFHPAILAMKNCALPTIARINGVAAGGGLGLSLTCDVTIAARSAFFVATFGPRLGIVPDLGTTWSLPGRVGRARALGMAMLGDRITAGQAAEWGLIFKAVDDDQLDAEVDRAVQILKRSSPEAVTRIRSSIDSAARRSFSDQLDLERDHQRVLIPLNMLEGAAAFLENREPNFQS